MNAAVRGRDHRLVEESHDTISALTTLMTELSSHTEQLRAEVARLAVLLDRIEETRRD